MTDVGLISSREDKRVIVYGQSTNSCIGVIVPCIGFASGCSAVRYCASGGAEDHADGLRGRHADQQRGAAYVYGDVCSAFTDCRADVGPHLDGDLHPYAGADLYATAHAYVNPDDYALSAAAATANCHPGAPGRGNGNHDDHSVFWISSYTYPDACSALSHS